MKELRLKVYTIYENRPPIRDARSTAIQPSFLGWTLYGWDVLHQYPDGYVFNEYGIGVSGYTHWMEMPPKDIDSLPPAPPELEYWQWEYIVNALAESAERSPGSEIRKECAKLYPVIAEYISALGAHDRQRPEEHTKT